MPPPIPATIAALHDAYRAGKLRPTDVVEAWLARDASERAAPVWISVQSPEVLRARASTLDAQLRTDPQRALASPVFGTLFAVKDNIDCAGLPTTAACPAFAYDPAEPAFVVAALEAAGAMVAGKTNLDQFATGLVGTRSPYGAPPNAFKPEIVSGGSSSGSAVAVAKGLVHFALGTDTAGSGRVPAGLNNLVGWKPTRGLLSVRGVVPACRSLDCVSIFTLTVADAARVFRVAATFDAADPCARSLALDRPLLRHEFTFAVPRAADLEFFGDSLAQAAFADAVSRMKALGGMPREIDFAPWREVADSLYDGPRVAERHAGIRAFFDAHADAVDPTVRRILDRGATFSATDTFVAEARLDELRAKLTPLWSTFDVLVVPTAPTAYSIAAVQADPIELNRRLGTYTNFANLLDLAAIAVPASMRPDGLPSGITLLAPAGGDLMLAHLAQRFHATGTLPLGAIGVAAPAAETLAGHGDTVQVAVVGAHLQGLPLNRELTERGAKLVRSTRTAPHYRLYALPATTPPKPGLVRTAGEGQRIAVEVWELPASAFGRFVAGIPAPLCIGTLELEDGSHVQGFLCEAAAIAGAEDISRFGGWRAYLESRNPRTTSATPQKETP
ncbi:Allophanate hydrolase [Usitatibacter rugosus]|uniref:Allophanate hydrolase n=1 Tax=Usitatibacter rugosus TaxID=2732067 RepID=A0A6M4H090_9PROT|nr:allophanate hydrolase [Usitatibacter rugosus]QJR12732.1 Allophanate hydrolase [Usitatibacter rugosus]